MSGKVGSITTSIIVDGLIFNMDAANRTSYPKTGTNVTDTINGNSGTLINDPTFDSANNGSIVFDGTDGKITIPDSNSNFSFNNGVNDLPFSLNIWVKISNNNSSADKNFFTKTNIWLISVDKFDAYATLKTGNPNTFIQRKCSFGNGWFNSYSGEWINFSSTYNGSETPSGIKLYLNGVRIDTTDVSSSTYTGMNPSSTNDIVLGNGILGSVANVQIYNKELSASEVLHNYNALKDRFI